MMAKSISAIKAHLTEWTENRLTKKNIVLSILFPIRLFKPLFVTWWSLPMLCLVGVTALEMAKNGIHPTCLPFTHGIRVLCDSFFIPLSVNIWQIVFAISDSIGTIFLPIIMWYSIQLAVAEICLMSLYFSTALTTIIIIAEYYLHHKIYPAMFRWLLH